MPSYATPLSNVLARRRGLEPLRGGFGNHCSATRALAAFWGGGCVVAWQGGGVKRIRSSATPPIHHLRIGAAGVEPAPAAYETAVLPLNHAPVVASSSAAGGTRTRTLPVKNRRLGQLSYRCEHFNSWSGRGRTGNLSVINGLLSIELRSTTPPIRGRTFSAVRRVRVELTTLRLKTGCSAD
jgi:hypothetical protein